MSTDPISNWTTPPGPPTGVGGTATSSGTASSSGTAAPGGTVTAPNGDPALSPAATPTATDRVAAEADTASWLSRRGALLAAAISVALLLAAVVVCLIVWLTPGTEPVNIPTVPRG